MRFSKYFLGLLLCFSLVIPVSQASIKRQYRDPETISVSKDNPFVTLIEEDNGFGGSIWFLQDYNTQLINLESYTHDKDGTVKWRFKVSNQAFVAPHLLEIKLAIGDPENMMSFQEHRYYLITDEE